jgi:SAM-dependent methyltransferase
MSVLDAFCGGGQNTIYFKHQGADVVEGCDISEEQCRIYKQRHPDCKVKCCSILESKYESVSFDLIVCDSLHHIHPYTKECLDEFYRLLKDDGFLLLWEPTTGSIVDTVRKVWQRVDNKYFNENEQSIDLKQIVRHYDNKMLLRNSFFGGNIGYLFIIGGMVLRIPHKYMKYYASFFLKIEKIVSMYQPKFFSFYVAAILQKKIYSK